MRITKEMEEALLQAAERESNFWNRHGISEENDTRRTGLATEAHKAWVKSVEYEYSVTEGDARRHLDTPMARQAFILGYRLGKKEPSCPDSRPKEKLGF